MSDYDSYAAAMHPNPKKQTDIWVNIGTGNGDMAVLTMGYGTISEDGFHEGYVGFAMQNDEEINQVIAMLNEAKGLVASYRKEFWLELGLEAPETEE